MKQVGDNYQLEARDVEALNKAVARYPMLGNNAGITGYMLVEGHKASFVWALNFARPGVNPGVVAIPVEKKGRPKVGPGMFLAVGERADLSADEWVVLWSSESEGPQRMVAREAGLSLGADPASVERDPDALEEEDLLISEDGSDDEFIKAHGQLMDEILEEDRLAALAALPGPTVVDVIADLPGAAHGVARGRCELEGELHGRGLLSGGSTVAEVMRNSILPNPYPFGTPERVWWGHGLLRLLKESEDGVAA